LARMIRAAPAIAARFETRALADLLSSSSPN